eukprot:3904378-Pleurochrysis_carterae.AAC.4
MGRPDATSHNLGAGCRAARPPAPLLDRPLGEIRPGDGAWVKEITRTRARWLCHRARDRKCAQYHW